MHHLELEEHPMGTDKRRRPLRFGRGIPPEKLAPQAPVKRLRKAIAATVDPDTDKPISDRRFATLRLRVNERTLRRYLDRTRPIPGPVEAIVAEILNDLPVMASPTPTAPTLERGGRSYSAALQP